MDSNTVADSADSILMNNMTSAELVVLALSLIIAIVTIGIVRNFRISTIETIDKTATSIVEENKDLLKEINKSLSPRIIHCASEVDVTREAVTMMRDVIKQHRDKNIYSDGNKDIDSDGNKDIDSDGNKDIDSDGNKDIDSDGNKDIDSDGNKDIDSDGNKDIDSDGNKDSPFITFYGSAGLGSHILTGYSKEELAHFDNFKYTLEQAIDAGVRVRRHINLFSPEEISRRSTDAQKSYLKWLITCFEFLILHPRFELIDNPRVPQWGASFSNLLTNQAILEIKANGLSAIAIYHKKIPSSIRESLRQARDMAQEGLIKQFCSTDSDSVKSFYNDIIQTAKDCKLNIDEIDIDDNLFFYNRGSHFDHYRRENQNEL